MALTDLLVKSAKAEKPAETKDTDGEGMYLPVTPTGKYWRLNYRFQGKRKTHALVVYPAISLANAHTRRAEAKPSWPMAWTQAK